MNKLLIKNGYVVSKDSVVDILIENGKIKEIGPKMMCDNCEVIDASGLYVLPGLVDMHCHLREPGQEYKEDIASGTRSAALGGFTSIACMPNTSPTIDNQTVAEFVINRAKEVGVTNVYPIGSISKGLKGEELSEIGELKSAGCVAISDDGKPVQSSILMKNALVYSSMFDILVISHCEDLTLVDEGVMNEGYMSTILGLKGIPSASEDIMVARDILLSEYTGVRIHIAHVSTETSVQLIREAKARGVRVTCETCPHYFSLTEEACDNFNTQAKMNPPLRTQKDVDAVIEGLSDGTIDVIATDHAPHHPDEKRCEFSLANFGIVGFETAFSLAYDRLVATGKLTIGSLVEKMCETPAKLLRIDAGEIDSGKSADLCIVDPEMTRTVDISKFASKSKNSPFDGASLKGAVIHTIVGGKVIVKNMNIVE